MSLCSLLEWSERLPVTFVATSEGRRSSLCLRAGEADAILKIAQNGFSGMEQAAGFRLLSTSSL